MSLIYDGRIDIEKVVFDKEQIALRVKELGQKITEDCRGKETVAVGVIKGSMYFFADLTRAIDLPLTVDMIGFGNIPDTTSRTGVVKVTRDIDTDIKGRHVIVIEDVIRTGLTTAYLISKLEEKKPAGIEVATMLLNPDRLLLPIPVKYYGFKITDSWLLGYGLDSNELGRNLPFIAALKKKG